MKPAVRLLQLIAIATISTFLIATQSRAQPLHDVLTTNGVAFPAAARDLDQPITSFAVMNDNEMFVIAYYWRAADDALPDSMHVRVLDKRTSAWEHAVIIKDRAPAAGQALEWRLGSMTRIAHAGDYLYLDSHLTPSAGTVLVLTRKLDVVAALNGWTKLVLGDGFVVYERSKPHFGPTYSAELRGYSPQSKREGLIYPRAPYDSIRTNYIADVRQIYRRVGDNWFRENNHHMDPERFDSTVGDTMVAGAQSIAFVMQFGGGRGSPASTPVVDVVVRCDQIRSESARCLELALAQLRRNQPDVSNRSILEELVRGR